MNNAQDVSALQVFHFFKGQSGCLKCYFQSDNDEKLCEMDKSIRSIANENFRIISIIVEKQQVEWVISYKNLTENFYEFWQKFSNHRIHPVDFDSKELNHECISTPWDIPITAFFSQGGSEEEREIKKIRYPIISTKNSHTKYFFEIFSDYIEKIENINLYREASNLEISYKNQWGEIIIRSFVPKETLSKLNQKIRSAFIFFLCLKRKQKSFNVKIPLFMRMKILVLADFWKEKRYEFLKDHN